LGSGITINLEIDTIVLDVQQAVPLGLILNESVTNAVKYAFTNKKYGQIKVILNTLGDSKLIFKVEDNGTGLPAELDLERSATMGMGMIKGLSRQLDGKLSILSHGGTKVEVIFTKAQFAETNS